SAPVVADETPAAPGLRRLPAIRPRPGAAALLTRDRAAQMIRSLHLVELTVSDHAASLRWYRDLLGLSPAPPEEPGRYAVLRAGDMRLSLKAGAASPGNVILAFEVDDLALTLAGLARHGVTP